MAIAEPENPFDAFLICILQVHCRCDSPVRNFWPARSPGVPGTGRGAAMHSRERLRLRLWSIGRSGGGSMKGLPHSSPSHLVAECFFAAPGFVKVDRPEGGDPMYAWEGTLINPGGAYNPAQWRAGHTSTRRRSRQYAFNCCTQRITFPPTRARYSGERAGQTVSIDESQMQCKMQIANCKMRIEKAPGTPGKGRPGPVFTCESHI